MELSILNFLIFSIMSAIPKATAPLLGTKHSDDLGSTTNLFPQAKAHTIDPVYGSMSSLHSHANEGLLETEFPQVLCGGKVTTVPPLGACDCKLAPLEMRANIITSLLSEMDNLDLSEKEPIHIIFLACGYLAHEVAIACRLIQEGYENLHFHLIDISYPSQEEWDQCAMAHKVPPSERSAEQTFHVRATSAIEGFWVRAQLERSLQECAGNTCNLTLKHYSSAEEYLSLARTSAHLMTLIDPGKHFSFEKGVGLDLLNILQHHQNCISYTLADQKIYRATAKEHELIQDGIDFSSF